VRLHAVRTRLSWTSGCDERWSAAHALWPTDSSMYGLVCESGGSAASGDGGGPFCSSSAGRSFYCVLTGS
jgi:hypothetical protein